jgi:LPS export ABC transporter protein LptC
MQKLKRWGFVALLILLGMEILTIAPGKLGAPQDILEKPKVSESPRPSSVTTTSQVMHGVHLVETGRGRKEWELDSEYAQGFKDRGNWKLQGVRVKFFGSSGTMFSVKGDSGSIQTETKDMEINGNVVTTTSEGYVFKSDSLKYEAGLRVLSTQSEVLITGPKDEQGQFELSAKGLVARMDSNVMDLKDNVRAVKSIPPDRTMTIKSLWSRINGKTNEAHFEDQVQVDIENFRMTGNMADFDYDPKTKALRSLVLQGNVKVTDQQHWAASQKAQVLFAKNEFILTGNPRVIQSDNELRGQEIRFINGGKEVKVLKARARVENDLEEMADQRKP